MCIYMLNQGYGTSCTWTFAKSRIMGHHVPELFLKSRIMGHLVPELLLNLMSSGRALDWKKDKKNFIIWPQKYIYINDKRFIRYYIKKNSSKDTSLRYWKCNFTVTLSILRLVWFQRGGKLHFLWHKRTDKEICRGRPAPKMWAIGNMNMNIMLFD